MWVELGDVGWDVWAVPWRPYKVRAKTGAGERIGIQSQMLDGTLVQSLGWGWGARALQGPKASCACT